jgi:hypothetical protein
MLDDRLMMPLNSVRSALAAIGFGTNFNVAEYDRRVAVGAAPENVVPLLPADAPPRPVVVVAVPDVVPNDGEPKPPTPFKTFVVVRDVDAAPPDEEPDPEPELEGLVLVVIDKV